MNFLQAPWSASPLDHRLSEIERQILELLSGMRQMTERLNEATASHQDASGATPPLELATRSGQ